MLTKIKNILFNTLLYKICFIIASFLFIVPFTYNYIAPAIKLFILWGILIIIYYCFNSKVITQKKFILITVGLFILFSAISAFVNNKSELYRNMIISLYLIAQVAVPLIVDQNKPRDKLLREITIISAIIFVMTFIAGILSFIIFINSSSFCFTNGYGRYFFGLSEGRLWGIFGDPNSGSIIAFISLLASLIIIVVSKDKSNVIKSKRILPLIYFNMLLQFIILSLGNSRATLICFCGAIFLLAVWLVRNYGFTKISNKILCLFVSATVIVAAPSSVIILSNVSNKIVGYIPKIQIYQIPEDLNEDGLNEEDSNTRRIYLTEDASNGRIEIWQAGLKVAANHIFFGVGSNNIMGETNQYLDENFLAKEPYIASNMHNIFLQILVGNGIFALLSFLALILFFVFKGFKLLFKRKNYSLSTLLEVIISVFLAGLCVANLFNSNILFFMCLFIAPVFWTYMGYFFYLNYENISKSEFNLNPPLPLNNAKRET